MNERRPRNRALQRAARDLQRDHGLKYMLALRVAEGKMSLDEALKRKDQQK